MTNELYLSLSANIILITILFYLLKNLKGDKFNEYIMFKVNKGERDKLKAYALIKGFKNENEYIEHLVKEELKKDQEKLNE